MNKRTEWIRRLLKLPSQQKSRSNNHWKPEERAALRTAINRMAVQMQAKAHNHTWDKSLADKVPGLIELQRLEEALRDLGRTMQELDQSLGQSQAKPEKPDEPEFITILGSIKVRANTPGIGTLRRSRLGVLPNGKKAMIDDQHGGTGSEDSGVKPLDEYSIGRIADRIAQEIIQFPRNQYGQMTEEDILGVLDYQLGDHQLAKKIAGNIFAHSRPQAITQEEIANIIIPALGGKPRVTVLGIPVVRKPR